jgi:hypothetical protein
VSRTVRELNPGTPLGRLGAPRLNAEELLTLGTEVRNAYGPAAIKLTAEEAYFWEPAR